MFKNVAGKFYVLAVDVSTNLPKSGDAANITAYVMKDDGAVTALADTSATEVDATKAKGLYAFDGTQAETNADCLRISGKSSTANVVVIGYPPTIYTRPTTGWLAPATAGRTLVVDADGLADANMVKIGASGAGVAAAASRLALSAQGIVSGVVGSSSSTTSIVTSSLDPAAAVTNQFVGKTVYFLYATTTANLRGQSAIITGNTSGGVLTVTSLNGGAMTTAPVSGDTFVIV